MARGSEDTHPRLDIHRYAENTGQGTCFSLCREGASRDVLCKLDARLGGVGRVQRTRSSSSCLLCYCIIGGVMWNQPCVTPSHRHTSSEMLSPVQAPVEGQGPAPSLPDPSQPLCPGPQKDNQKAALPIVAQPAVDHATSLQTVTVTGDSVCVHVCAGIWEITDYDSSPWTGGRGGGLGTEILQPNQDSIS